MINTGPTLVHSETRIATRLVEPMTHPTASRLAELNVLTPGGDSVPMQQLWANQPIVLALIRHFG